jgi:hypothetical protein
MMTTATEIKGRSLAQTLAVQSQIHLPGTVGRLLKQIRDLERVAPLFIKSGMVRAVARPNPLDLRVAGIATRAATQKTIGGHLYVAAANRIDLTIVSNAISTTGQDSTCEIDDINYESQSKRLQLINIRQAYEMADAALKSGNRLELILFDSPLLLNRDMVPPKSDPACAPYRRAFDDAIGAISDFWSTHRESLFPWNGDGPIVAGIASERYGAIVHIAQSDLRTAVGRRQILKTEKVDTALLDKLAGSDEAILGIGERRFVYGILGAFTRTATFRMNIQTPEMEPKDFAQYGVLGFHFKAAQNNSPLLVQFLGDEPLWTRADIDRLAAQVMAITSIGGRRALPLPIQLAAREQRALDQFIEYYSRSLKEQIRRREVEDLWLSDIDEFSAEGVSE